MLSPQPPQFLSHVLWGGPACDSHPNVVHMVMGELGALLKPCCYFL